MTMIMRVRARRWLCRSRAASALAGILALGAVALIAAFGSAAAPAIVGAARVVDGDTLDIAGVRVRLEGIDAPEIAQICPRRITGTWPCGKVAAAALTKLIGKERVACESRGTDRYGRMLGVCFVDGHDIDEAMVRNGLAWAFVRYSTRYVQEETEARALKVGIWQADAEPAWIYRQRGWKGAEQAAPRGCAIKGNVSANGHIYHMPWSPWYDKVKINERKGERWFCSEAEALAAGWRPVAAH
jgi:endonuclease YncB( thermonuclease family)